MTLLEPHGMSDVQPSDSVARPKGPVISIRHLHKTFKRRAGGGDVKPVDDVNLEIDLGELVVLLGPSGCGKTTLLRCVAGLERPDEGEIEIDGKVVFSSEKGIFVPPNHRRLSMIFQSYALWPHMSVEANVAYPLQNEAQKRPKADIRAAVERILSITGLSGLGKQYPGQLSGGQQQRVALARALVADPDVVLFDEPLSNVDAQVREQLRVEILSMQRRLGFAALYVTHDQAEAMELGHRIAVLHEGRIEQVGTARQVYHSPSNLYVAGFIGTTNSICGRVESLGPDGAEVTTAAGTLPIAARGVTGAVRQRVLDEGAAECVLVFRPEAIDVRAVPTSREAGTWQGVVRATMFLGAHVEYLLDVGNLPVRAWSDRDRDLADGDQVELVIDPARVLAFAPEAQR